MTYALDTQEIETSRPIGDTQVTTIRGHLGSKMGVIRKRTNNQFFELEFKNQ